MHLTPRTLLSSVAATLTACTLVGILGTLERPQAATANAGDTASLSQTPTTRPSTLVDPRVEDASGALPTAPANPLSPTPTPPPASSGPITSSPTPSKSAQAASSPSANDQDGEGDPATAARRPATREPARATPPTTRAPTEPRPAPVPRRTAVKSSWHRPALRVGTTSITRPRLTSGARVSVTVACAPGAGCSMSGSQLTVSPGTSVTVTWSAPARRGYTAWRTSRVL